MTKFKEMRLNMVKKQLQARGIKTSIVIQAFRKIPRELFVLPQHKNFAYDDAPLPIGEYQTISQPYMAAKMLELLELTGKEKVLEIGSGSGYLTALLAECSKKVFSLEIVSDLAYFAQENIKKIDCKNAKIINADGAKGYPKEAPYDRIVVSAYTSKAPSALKEQLREGGIMAISIGNYLQQQLTIIKRKNGKLIEKKYDTCNFVPLI